MSTGRRGDPLRRFLGDPEKITQQAVMDAAKKFMFAWNKGDVEGACELYAEQATFLTSGKLLKGKQAILAYYRATRPGAEPIDTLELHLMEFTSPSEANGMMASAVFLWVLYDLEGKKKASGYTLETYVFENGHLRLIQDATV